jgi:hypothetical protein
VSDNPPGTACVLFRSSAVGTKPRARRRRRRLSNKAADQQSYRYNTGAWPADLLERDISYSLEVPVVFIHGGRPCQ